MALLPIDTVPENGRLRVLYHRNNNRVWLHARAGGKLWRLNRMFDTGPYTGCSVERVLQLLRDISRRGTIDTDHWHEIELVGYRFERVSS